MSKTKINSLHDQEQKPSLTSLSENTHKTDDVILSQEQRVALDLLNSGENVFLTGGAGCGKSFIIQQFLKNTSAKTMPILASTGAAAVLIGGRTFHSFFGLGLIEGGFEATYKRVCEDSKTMKRISQIEGFIIDEISMISGEVFSLAELLARKAKQSTLPWGGLRVIVVGDFNQLPPINRNFKVRDWCFLSEAWIQSGFTNIELKLNQRTKDFEFLSRLQDIRLGKWNSEVVEFLQKHTRTHDESKPGLRLFPRRDQSEIYNIKKLDEINEEEVQIPTVYFGEEKFMNALRKSLPIPAFLKLKIGCYVMLLKNDPLKRWVNGTRGQVTEINDLYIKIRKKSGREVTVEKASFSWLDAEGIAQATAIQFPVTLAYATTIHKSQGSTLDELWCDLGSLWEPGHAYVALSRLKSADGLNIVRWSKRSFAVDPRVHSFYQTL